MRNFFIAAIVIVLAILFLVPPSSEPINTGPCPPHDRDCSGKMDHKENS